MTLSNAGQMGRGAIEFGRAAADPGELSKSHVDAPLCRQKKKGTVTKRRKIKRESVSQTGLFLFYFLDFLGSFFTLVVGWKSSPVIDRREKKVASSSAEIINCWMCRLNGLEGPGRDLCGRK